MDEQHEGVEPEEEETEMSLEEAAEALPLEYKHPRDGKIKLLAPAASGARPSALVSAMRLYADDRTVGGAACLALLYRRIGKRFRAGRRGPADYGADTFDYLISRGWTIIEATQLCELAALHVGLYTQRLNISEARDF